MPFSRLHAAIAGVFLIFSLLTAVAHGQVGQITTHPTAQVAPVGGSATFSVTATTTSGGPTFQWQVSTDRGTTFANVASGGNAATYTVTNVTALMNNYQYRCFVNYTTSTGGTSIQSFSAPLYVSVPLNVAGDTKTLTAMAVKQTQIYTLTLAAGSAGVRLALNTSGTGTADLYIQRNALPTTTSYLKASTAQAVDVIFLSPTEATAGTYYIMVTRPTAETTGTPDATLTYTNAYAPTLNWDPGTTDVGTEVYTAPGTNTGGTYYFTMTTQATSVGAWRTALRVTSGTADIYLKQGSVPSSTSDYNYRSINTGTTGDGFVVPGTSFAAGQTWYLMVVASQNAQWSLVSGEAYVQDLGTLATTTASSTGVVQIGAEGYRFFKTSPSSSAAAWRMWLNDGAATPAMLTGMKLAVRQNLVPFIDTVYDHQQLGHMLLVPPYLNIGGNAYFIAVSGTPGTSFALDSRAMQLSNNSPATANLDTEIPVVPFGADNVGFTMPRSGYAMFRTQVPVDQIGWEAALRNVSSNIDLAVRRSNAASEWFNDALSETAGTAGDSVTLVPAGGGSTAGLTDGTYFITVHQYAGGGTVAPTGTLVSRIPFTTTTDDVTFVGSTLNNEAATALDDTNPNKVGWRYFRVGVADAAGINEQLGKLGWDLSLSGAPTNTDIALRRNYLPGKAVYRNGFSQSTSVSTATYYQDFNSAGSSRLQRPAHQADIWYVGVYNGASALGNFTLARSEITPTTLTLATSTSAVTSQAPGIWNYFKVVIPDDPTLLGWDLRTLSATGPLTMIVRRDTLPLASSYDFSATTFWSRATTSAGTSDFNRYMVKSIDVPPFGTQTASRLYAGTYYIAVRNDHSAAISYTLQSRGIGTVASTYPLKTQPLNFTNGVATITNLNATETSYYAVDVPADAKTWALNVVPSGTGELGFRMTRGQVPELGNFPTTYYSTGQWDKAGQDLAYFAKSSSTDTSSLPAGRYFIAVGSAGNSPASESYLGTGAASGTLTSVGEMPVTTMNGGVAITPTEATSGVSLVFGEVKLYKFTIAAGTLSAEIRLTNRTGNPYMTVVKGDYPSLGYLYFNGYDYNNVSGGAASQGTNQTLITLTNPVPGDYIVAVRAAIEGTSVRNPASATLGVVANVPQPVAFANGTITMTNQPVGTVRYFTVDVPDDATLLGWDLRVVNTNGPLFATVRRGSPPDSTGYDFTMASFWSRTTTSAGTPDYNRYMVKSIDLPPFGTQLLARLYAGTYYIAVRNDHSAAISYTVQTRGIGTAASTYPLKVQPLNFTNGTATITNLNATEVAYYVVDVPAEPKTWAVNVVPSGTGELGLRMTRAQVPELGNFSTTYYSTGQWDKAGQELVYFGRASSTDLSNLPAGRYYLAVGSAGNSPTNENYLGTGAASGTLTSVGEMPVTTMNGGAAITPTEATQGVSLVFGEVKLYKFTIAAGTLSAEIRLTNRTGNPYMTVVKGDYPSLGYLYFNGYDYSNVSGGAVSQGTNQTLITLTNPAPGDYTVAVRAAVEGTNVRNAASATLGVVANVPQPLAFANGSIAMTNQPVGTVRYFTVDVPDDATLLGWDLRTLNTNGPLFVTIRRGSPPDNTGSDFTMTSFWSRSTASTGSSDYNRYMVKSIDLPPFGTQLASRLYAGTYYIAVRNDHSAAINYTLQSRGLGTAASTYPLKVQPLNFTNGTATITNLNATEVAYYAVDIPSSAKTWGVNVVPSGTGELGLRMTRGQVPELGNFSTTYYTTGQWDKAGTDLFYIAKASSTDTGNLPAGRYYLAVGSAGNSPVNESYLGTGAASGTLTSVGELPPSVLNGGAAIGTTEATSSVSLAFGEVKLYKFTVAAGTLSTEIRLTNRTGNPYMTVVRGDYPSLAYLYFNGYDYNNVYAGAVTQGTSQTLITLTNPAPGDYTVAVRGAVEGTNIRNAATATLGVVARAAKPLNFSSAQNASGGTNVDSSPSGTPLVDGQRVFYRVTIPTTLNGAAPLGWKLSASTSQGAVSLYVYRDSQVVGTAAVSAGSTERSLVVAPPMFTPGGTYLVEARAQGATVYTLTSEAVTLKNAGALWQIPTAAAYTSSADIGDSGQIDLANGDYDFYGVVVPAGNMGVLRTVIEAISGNPDLYIRRASVPSRNHPMQGGVDDYYRSLTATSGTEYGNWVPLANTDTQLQPGTYYLMVHAAGNTNVRYRLRVSPGAVQTLALNGGSVTGQLLNGGDWRYYKFTVPAEGTAPQSWSLSFAQTSGDVVMFLRDTNPPGFATNSSVLSWGQDSLVDWQRDNKDGDYSRYDRYDPAATYTFNSPPMRPGHTYYVGFYAKNDANFTFSSSTSGTLPANTEIPYYTGSLSNVSIPANSSLVYKMVAPADAGRLRFLLAPSANIGFSVQNGTVPVVSGTNHFQATWAPTNGYFDMPFTTWPWVPGATYYLRLTNSSGSPVTFSLTSDSGRVGIYRQPGTVQVASGATASLTVGAGGTPAPTYQWRRNNVDVVNGGRISGANTATLTITNATTADAGDYQVVVSNTTAAGASSLTGYGTISVDGSPFEAATPSNPATTAGSSAGASVLFYSTLPISVVWQQSTDNGANWTDLFDGGSFSFSTSPLGSTSFYAYLSMANVPQAWSGYRYRAIASNVLGSTTSSVLTLTVNTPPAITTQPLPQTVNVGQPFSFSVVATGVPAPSYQWRRNGGDISGATSATYSKSSATSADAGTYFAYVYNTAGGVSSASVALTVNKSSQSITFAPIADRSLLAGSLLLQATASSGLTVSFSVVSGPAQLSGNTLSFTGAGFVTVRATQAGNADYDAATSVDRTFEVQAGFSSWQTDNFTVSERANSAISGPTADPDGDGLANLVEYALGLNPKSPAPWTPTVANTGTEWVFTYTRPAARTDITYVVETSNDLTSWSTTGVTHSRVATGTTETWEARAAASTVPRFFRIRVATVAN